MGMSMDSQFSISAPLISDKCIALLFVPFFHFSRNTRGHSYLSFVFMIGCKSPFLRHKDNVFFSLLSTCTVPLTSPWLHHLSFSFLSFLFVFSSSRSLTSNLPNVNLPKVPNLAVPVNLPTFSAPTWMAAISDTECVLSLC